LAGQKIILVAAKSFSLQENPSSVNDPYPIKIKCG